MSTMASSLAGRGEAEVTIISEDSPSDSDEELFNMAQVTDRTRLLNGDQMNPSKHANVRNNNALNSGAKTLQLKPETMEQELNGKWTKVSSALLPAEVKEAEARQEGQKEVWRKILLLCVVVLFLFIGMPLHSPSLLVINITDTKTQVIVLGCLYSAVVLSSITAPILVKALDIRLSVILGCAGVSTFICGKFDPSLYIVIPGCIVAGLCTGPCLCAIWTYATLLAKEYCLFTNKDLQKSLLVFSGMFHSWFLGAIFFSQLFHMIVVPFPWTAKSTTVERDIGSLAIIAGQMDTNLTSLLDNQTGIPEINISSTTWSPLDLMTTYVPTTTGLRQCGPKYCWENFLNDFSWVLDTSGDPYQYRIQALLGCYLVCSLGALVLSVLVIDRVTEVTTAESQEYETIWSRVHIEHLLTSVTFVGHSDILLLIPAMVYVGIQHLIGYSLYMQAFVACDLDPRHGAFAFLCAAATPLLLCAPLGVLASIVGRIKLLLPTAVLQATLLILYLAWPGDWGLAVYLTLAGLWALADGVWQVILTGLLGVTFPTQIELAMAHYPLWSTVGCLLVYSSQALHLCSQLPLVVTLLALSFATLMYVAMEIRLRLREQDSRSGDDHNLVMPQLEEATWLPNINPMHIRKERTTALLNRIPGGVDSDLVST